MSFLTVFILALIYEQTMNETFFAVTLYVIHGLSGILLYTFTYFFKGSQTVMHYAAPVLRKAAASAMPEASKTSPAPVLWIHSAPPAYHTAALPAPSDHPHSDPDLRLFSSHR